MSSLCTTQPLAALQRPSTCQSISDISILIGRAIHATVLQVAGEDKGSLSVDLARFVKIGFRHWGQDSVTGFHFSISSILHIVIATLTLDLVEAEMRCCLRRAPPTDAIEGGSSPNGLAPAWQIREQVTWAWISVAMHTVLCCSPDRSAYLRVFSAFLVLAPTVPLATAAGTPSSRFRLLSARTSYQNEISFIAHCLFFAIGHRSSESSRSRLISYTISCESFGQ